MNLNYLYIGLFNSNIYNLTEIPQRNSNYNRIEMGPGEWFYLNKNTRDTITNAVEIIFPDANWDWGIITHFGIFDSPQKGKLLVTGKINVASIVTKDDKIKFNVGNISIPLEKFEQIKSGIEENG